MRITVLVVFGEQQHTALAHEFDNPRIGFEDTLTGKVLDFGREVAGVIHRAVDLETVPLTDYKVVVTVARRGVHAAGACLAGNFLLSRLSDVEFDFGVSFAAQRYVLSHHQE